MNSLFITKYKPAIILTLALTVFLTSCKPTIKSWKVSTLAGTGAHGHHDGTGRSAQFWFPAGVAVDSKGNVYVADRTNCCIRKITPGGVVITLAGNGRMGFANGFGTEAQFDHPADVAVDSSGNVYVADNSNHRIRKITPERKVTTLAGSGTEGFANGIGEAAQFNFPVGVAVDLSGNVYVGDTKNNRIRKITPEGVVTTLAGSTSGYKDATGTEAQFDEPRGVAVDSSGNVYVVDSYNNCIRKITPEGVVSTLAGSGVPGYHDATATEAQFNDPTGVAVDSKGNVYVADSFNDFIRKITPEGVVSTFAGSTWGYADGSATEAQFSRPESVAVDSSDNLYVADIANHRIRKIEYK